MKDSHAGGLGELSDATAAVVIATDRAAGSGLTLTLTHAGTAIPLSNGGAVPTGKSVTLTFPLSALPKGFVDGWLTLNLHRSSGPPLPAKKLRLIVAATPPST